MYERFTDHAREVMNAAGSEARRCRHEYIGTEHLLLALANHGRGTATVLLESMGVHPNGIQNELENVLIPGPAAVSVRRGFFRRWWQSDRLPQTPRAKKVIEYAVQEARALNHNYIGTEHLLLGLVREQEGVAAQVLSKLGLELDDLRRELVRLLEQGRH